MSTISYEVLVGKSQSNCNKNSIQKHVFDYFSSMIGDLSCFCGFVLGDFVWMVNVDLYSVLS